MLYITPPALRHLVSLRGQKGLDAQAAARFAPSSTGISLSYARSPEPGDRTIDAGEIEIYVAQELAHRFDNATIDLEARDGVSALIFRRHANRSVSTA